MHKEDCIFCKIIKGEIPCEKIYEDDNCLAFLSIGPVRQGHSLVIPKNHSDNILSINSEDSIPVFENVRKLSQVINRAMNSEGINVSIEGVEVSHFHVHIIPRYDEKHSCPVEDKKNLKDIGNLIRKEIENENS